MSFDVGPMIKAGLPSGHAFSTLPDNPTEYREHVKRCLVLVGEASSPIAKAQLEYLAQTWMDLADVIDRTGRFSRTR